MRLLRLNANDKLTITDFSNKAIPPYAILSHRWAKDEVLFEHIKDGSYRKKEGYQKIIFCAKQAKRDELQYFWVDTCCIDKWNLRELSKAINSMYNWYRNAASCYVFLSDVSTPTIAAAQEQPLWQRSFELSQWFTRGWTLQELIAPKTATFFSLEGYRLGDKISLESLICDITKIPAKALHGYPLEEFSISERKSWAQSRITTEPEDSAYCLLGILNVVMPTTYGEGKDKALQRLQNEIDTGATTPSVIPFSRDHRFVGDAKQLAELQTKMSPKGGDVAILAITGSAGIGKSRLALELAYMAKNNGLMVFWVNASDGESLVQAYGGIAQKLDIPGWDNEHTNVKGLVKVHLEKTISIQWLLVFDNVENVTIRPEHSSELLYGHLDEYLPRQANGSVILTTTMSEIVANLPEQNVVTLQHGTEEVAEKIFENHLDRPVLASERPELKLLLKELQYLPLAVAQAAGCFRVQRPSIDVYRARLTLESRKFYAADAKLFDGGGERDTGEPVMMTLLASLYYIQQEIPSAAERLFLAACLDRRDILLDLLEMGAPNELRSVIDILHNYALITRRPAESSIDVHQTTHTALRNWLRRQQMLKGWAQTAITQLLKVFPDDSHFESRSKWRRLMSHTKVATALELPSQQNDERIELLGRFATALRHEGRYKESVLVCCKVVDTHVAHRGVWDEKSLLAAENFAQALRSVGDIKNAEMLLSNLHVALKGFLGPEHPQTVRILDRLGTLYFEQGRLKEAEKVGFEVLSAIAERRGGYDYDKISPTTQLANVYAGQGRYEEAKQLRDLSSPPEAQEADHPDSLISMRNLAIHHTLQGRFDEAESLLNQVIETNSKTMGEEHPHTLRAVARLGMLYINQGRSKEAEELLLKVVQTTARVLGQEHNDTLEAMAFLSQCYVVQQRLSEAEELKLKVIVIGSRTLGERHVTVAELIHTLGETYVLQRRFDKAEETFIRMLRLSVDGENGHRELEAQKYLMLMYKHQGRFWEARELEGNLVETLPEESSERPNELLISMANIAAIHTTFKRWAQAERLHLKVLEVIGRATTHTINDRPNILAVLQDLTMVYACQSKWEQAETVLVQLMDVSSRVRGAELVTLEAMCRLAQVFYNSDRFIEAETLAEQVVMGNTDLLGTVHPITAEAMRMLVTWRRQRTAPSSLPTSEVADCYDNPLNDASYRGQVEIVKSLLSKGADVNEQAGYYGYALQAASSQGHLETVRLLLESDADINAHGGHFGNALQAASCEGHLEIVKLLLRKNADVNAHGGHYGNALQAATLKGHLDVASYLIEKNADVNAHGGRCGTALQAAAFGNCSELAILLLSTDLTADITITAEALHVASFWGNIEIVRILLENGTDVNTQRGHYGSALRAASCNGHIEIVELLLEKGADVNRQGSQYGNALQAASSRGHRQVVKLLLEKGANINVQGGFYGTALQAASAEGHLKIARQLLQHGADVNVRGGHYCDALHAASFKRHTEVVELLLNHGAKGKEPEVRPHDTGKVLGNFAASSCGMHIEDPCHLVAECRAIDHQFCRSGIDLNNCLTNVDGTLAWKLGGNFAASAREIKLTGDGQYLEAELRSRNGTWVAGKIWLCERITNTNGRLEML